jgi:hypothetical protein
MAKILIDGLQSSRYAFIQDWYTKVTLLHILNNRFVSVVATGFQIQQSYKFFS